MQRARGWWLSWFLVCGTAASVLPACDVGAEGPEESPPAGEPSGPGEVPGEVPGGTPGEVSAAVQLDANGCLERAAGAGFGAVVLPAAVALGVTDFDAVVTGAQLDAVIGLQRGTAGSFDRLATAVRFAPSGLFDARDGAAYRAEQAVAFQPHRTYRVRFVADVPSRRYSVYVHDPASDEVVRIARRYAFRTSQSGAAQLDALSAIVDGPSGQLTLCSLASSAPAQVAYAREGAHAVAPLPADQLLASDGVTTTWKLGAAGQVLGEVARGGAVAADEAGNVYVALASGGQLALYAYTAQLAPRWSRVEPVDAFADVSAIAASAESGVLVALSREGGLASVRRFAAAGGAVAVVYAHGGGGGIAALAPDGFAVASAGFGQVVVSLHAPDGATEWFQAFQSEATVEVVTLGLGGRVAIGGHFSAPIDFGGTTLDPVFNGEVDVNSYVAAFVRAGGAHAFTARIPTTQLTGAAGNGARLVIAGETWVTPIFPHLWQVDLQGEVLPGEPYTGFSEEWGRSGRVAMGASGRIYWERSMVWPRPVSPAFPYLLAIGP